MKCSVENKAPCRRVLSIEVPAETVAAAMGEVTDAYVRSAALPGFRKGKAPRRLVERRYAAEIRADAKERVLPQAYHDALEREKIDAVAVLHLDEQPFEEGRPFAFEVTVDVAPAFQLPTVEAIPLKAENVEIGEDAVDAMIDDLRDGRATYDAAEEGVVAAGDMVQIDYEGTVDGQPMTGLAPDVHGLDRGENYWMIADRANAFIPEFADALQGASSGETRTVEAVFPEPFDPPALAGRTAVYQVAVKAIRKKTLPELNDEWAKQLGMESVDGLRDHVRDILTRRAEEERSRTLRQGVADHLLKNTALDVPESEVDRETSGIVRDIVARNARRGVPTEEIEKHREDIVESAAKSAVDQIKLRYILHRVADEKELAVEESDVTRRIAVLAMQSGMNPEDFRKELVRNGAVDNVREQLRAEKAMEWLIERADIQST
jgi:trigger factor